MHIPDAANNVIPYEIYPTLVRQRSVLKAKRLRIAMRLCTGTLDTVADKLRYARLSAGMPQEEPAAWLGIDRTTLTRYEAGIMAEENMQAEVLVNAAILCGRKKYFCCNPYHIFVYKDAGKQVMRYRKNLGLTQVQLADRLGVTQTTVKRWERNVSKPPVSIWELVAGIRFK